MNFVVAAAIRHFLHALFLATLTVASAKAASPVKAEPASRGPVESSEIRQERHALRTGDLVLIRVFQEDDLDSTLRVGEDGAIVFPLVGAVKVAGQSTTEAAATLRNALKQGYLRNPQVTVTVMEAYKYRFTILGQVQKPGAYDIPAREKLTLLQAIGMAGGYTSIADPGKVLVKRQVQGHESVVKLNAKEMARGSSSSGYEILPGDVITVGESWY